MSGQRDAKSPSLVRISMMAAKKENTSGMYAAHRGTGSHLPTRDKIFVVSVPR